jgi:dCTP deaminase
MILSAQSIRARCSHVAPDWHENAGQPTVPLVEPLLFPFIERERFLGTSTGLSPAGYDLRLVLAGNAPEHWLAPGEFILAAALEKFTMPRDLLGIVHDKSTWARRGLSVFNTVIEPGWRGYLTLELVNKGANTIHLQAGQGIAQVVFHLLDAPTEEPYPEDAKYQDQEYGPVGAKT